MKTPSYKALAQFIWRFIRLQPWKFTFVLFIAFAFALDFTLWPYLLRRIIDVLTQYEMDRAAVWVSLAAPAFFALLLWIALEICGRSQGQLLARAIPKLEADIRMTMFDHIQHHSPKYFQEHFAGTLSNKISDMTTNVTEILQLLFWTFIPLVSGALFSLFFFAGINSFFALLLGGLIAVYFTVCIIFTPKCGRLEHLHGEVRSSLAGRIVDSLTNNFAVNLFFRFRYEKGHIQRFQQEEQASNYAAKRHIEYMRLSLAATFFVGGIGINGLMLHWWAQGRLTTGEVVQIFNTIWNMITIFWMAGVEFPHAFQSVGLAKQALSVMETPQDILDTPHARPLIVSRGEITFENVSFHYGKEKLFQDKHVQIRAGEKVGLVGYSGAGKSTFVSLILRFYPLSKGKILIDGQEIAQATLESIRSQIALIPQDPFLFHRSLEENIHYGKLNTTHEEVVRVAKLAHCDEFIRRRPEGYATIVGERGTKLSGGERQRIAIARAMLADAPILILDEATSALDSVTEGYIQESLERLMQSRTTIVIAHRLSTLAKMDRILVFDQGKIIEEGTHDTLLNQGGHYARMWQMQAGGFLPE